MFTQFIKALVNAILNPTYTNTGGVAPDLAAAVTLTGGKSWAYGAWQQIAAAATVTADWWIYAAYPTAVVVNDEYQVQLGTGAAASEAAMSGSGFRVGITQTSGVGEVPSIPWHYAPYPLRVASGTRIAARVANAAAGANNTLALAIAYRTGLQ